MFQVSWQEGLGFLQPLEERETQWGTMSPLRNYRHLHIGDTCAKPRHSDFRRNPEV